MFNNLIDFVTGLVVRMRHNEAGQTMAEYGILIGVIALVVVVAAVALGGNISSAFSTAGTKI